MHVIPHLLFCLPPLSYLSCCGPQNIKALLPSLSRQYDLIKQYFVSDTYGKHLLRVPLCSHVGVVNLLQNHPAFVMFAILFERRVNVTHFSAIGKYSFSFI